MAQFESAEDFLKECSDEELFGLIINAGKEIKDRIVALLKEHRCTSIGLSEMIDLEAEVNDTYDTHGFGVNDSRWVKVKEVGFTDVWYEGEVCQNVLYLITDKDEQFSNDEIEEDTLWDVYKTLKDEFKNFDKI